MFQGSCRQSALRYQTSCLVLNPQWLNNPAFYADVADLTIKEDLLGYRLALTAKQSHSDTVGGSNTCGNRTGHAFNRFCPILTLSSSQEDIPFASLRRFNPSLSEIRALTELIPTLPSKGHRRYFSSAEMAVASSGNTGSAPSYDLQHGAADGVGGSTRLPQIGSSRTNVGSAMFLQPEEKVAGGASPIFTSLGRRPQASMTVACS
jgi:hypothetical protein